MSGALALARIARWAARWAARWTSRRPTCRAARRAAAALVACSLCLACAGAPKTPGAGRPVQSAPSGSRPPASTSSGRNAGPQSAYLRGLLGSFTHRVLANGIVVDLYRKPGTIAALRISYARRPAVRPAEARSLETLALEAAARGPADLAPGTLEQSLETAGAELRLDSAPADGPALELSCPVERLLPLLELIGRGFAAPAFRPEEFETGLQRLRIEERKEHTDLALRASLERGAGSDAAGGLARGLAGPDFLATLRLEDLKQYWSRELGPERLRISVVADVDPPALMARFAVDGGFAAMPRSAAAVQTAPTAPAAPAAPAPIAAIATTAASPAVSPILRPLAGYQGRALLRGDFPAPRPDSPDSAALLVALTMLDELLGRELSLLDCAPEEVRLQLSEEDPRRGSLELSGPGEAAKVLDAAGRALRELAAGSCVDLGSRKGELQPLGAGLVSYRARCLVRYYAGKGSAAELARRISRQARLDADGMAFFRLADAISVTSAEELSRVVRDDLSEGALTWIALGDPVLLGSLATAAAKPQSPPGP